MKKVAASTQNTNCSDPRRRAFKLSSTKLPVGRGGTGGIDASPSGARPSSCGRSLVSSTNSTIMTNKPMLEGTNDRPQELRSEEHTSELQSHSDLVCRL